MCAHVLSLLRFSEVLKLAAKFDIVTAIGFKVLKIGARDPGTYKTARIISDPGTHRPVDLWAQNCVGGYYQLARTRGSWRLRGNVW